MHLFDQPELAGAAFEALMGARAASVAPAARGGRNAVFKIRGADGALWALRLGALGSGPEFSSGWGWQRALADRGVPAIVAHAMDAEGSAVGYPCSIAPWTSAIDAERVVGSLSEGQLDALGEAMAGWSRAMLPMASAHPARGAGRLLFGAAACSDPSWWEHLEGNARWRLSKALANPAWSAPRDQRLISAMGERWLSMRAPIESAPLSLFAWDIGDRNAMLDPRGRPVALVDVDELMMGDPLLAPALAWAALAIQGLPTRHARAWARSGPWSASEAQERLPALEGYWLINLCSKVGLASSTGLAESGASKPARALMREWMDGHRP